LINSRERLIVTEMPSILFVCTANICRSPMAAALFKGKLEREGEKGIWRIESAGTWARDGFPAAEKSQSLLGERGLSLDRHQSRSVSCELLKPFDLILTMERGQKEALRVEFPKLAPRIYLLTEMVGEHADIKDPIGGPTEEYEKTIHDMEEIFEKGYKKIIKLARHSPPIE
jgi:protein-tyrosine phosphatase